MIGNWRNVPLQHDTDCEACNIDMEACLTIRDCNRIMRPGFLSVINAPVMQAGQTPQRNGMNGKANNSACCRHTSRPGTHKNVDRIREC